MNDHADGRTHCNASGGLCKMVWFAAHFPEKAQRIARWIHAPRPDYWKTLMQLEVKKSKT